MSYIITRVNQGVAYLWGECFALINNDTQWNDGWYYATVSDNVFKDAKGVERHYVTLISEADTDDLQRLLDMYYGTPDGIKDILSNYKHLVPSKIRCDSRFNSLEALVKAVDYSNVLAKEYEMANFVSKVCSIVVSRIIKDKFVKKETVIK